MLLQILFTPDDRKQAILDGNHGWAEQGGDAAAQTAWLTVDLRWNHNVDANYRPLQLARQGFEEAIHLAGQKTANCFTTGECQQKTEEQLSAFLSRFFKQVRMFGGGVDPEAEADRLLTVSTFVQQTGLDIKKFFSKHVPSGVPAQKLP